MAKKIIKKAVKKLLYDAMKEDDRVKLLTLYNKGMDLPYGSPAHKKVMKEIDELREKQPHLESVQSKPKKMFRGGLAKKGYGKAYLKGRK
jgi:hypothetical protein